VLRRIAIGVGCGLGLLVAGAGAWAVFFSLYDPRVPLAEPVVIERTPGSPDIITLALAGDFAPADKALALIETQGYRFPYLGTAEIMRSADIAFANLEAPVTEARARLPRSKDWFYRVEPQATDAWSWLGLDLINLANNHILDYRAVGVTDTVRHLDAAGLPHIGAGADERAARRPVIFDVGGTRIGFLGYLQDKVGYNLYLGLYAVGGRAGAAKLTERDISEDVRRLRPLCDVLLVSVHWGENYAPVDANQERWGRRLLELGVDVVIGHHSHDVQAAEVSRGGGVILYSLGNYAWGAPGHYHMRIGFIARLGVTPRRGEQPARLKFVELLPIVTQNRIVNFQPRLLHPEEVEWLDPFLEATRARGTRVDVAGTMVKLQLPE